MVYKKGDKVINFYEDAPCIKSESAFVKANKDCGLGDEELKQVYALIEAKTKPKKAVKEVPPSLN
jgi:hypothetical protein